MSEIALTPQQSGCVRLQRLGEPTYARGLQRAREEQFKRDHGLSHRRFATRSATSWGDVDLARAGTAVRPQACQSQYANLRSARALGEIERDLLQFVAGLSKKSLEDRPYRTTEGSLFIMLWQISSTWPTTRITAARWPRCCTNWCQVGRDRSSPSIGSWARVFRVSSTQARSHQRIPRSSNQTCPSRSLGLCDDRVRAGPRGGGGFNRPPNLWLTCKTWASPGCVRRIPDPEPRSVCGSRLRFSDLVERAGLRVSADPTDSGLCPASTGSELCAA